MLQFRQHNFFMNTYFQKINISQSCQFSHIEFIVKNREQKIQKSTSKVLIAFIYLPPVRRTDLFEEKKMFIFILDLSANFF